MGLDPLPLFKFSDQEQRMEQFYWMVGTFSPDIIFKEYTHLSRKGFRWASRSFLSQSELTNRVEEFSEDEFEDDMDPSEAKLSGPDGGLLISLPGVRVGKWVPIMAPKYTLHLAEIRRFGLESGYIPIVKEDIMSGTPKMSICSSRPNR